MLNLHDRSHLLGIDLRNGPFFHSETIFPVGSRSPIRVAIGRQVELAAVDKDDFVFGHGIRTLRSSRDVASEKGAYWQICQYRPPVKHV